LAPGTAAYVDRDWLPALSQTVPSLTVAADGSLAWCEGPSAKAPGVADPDTAAALALLSVAREAAAAVAGLPRGSVEVAGNGLIAHLVRALVGDSATRSAERPRAVVDVIGDPAVIVDATRRVADLGTIVLVGEALGRRAEMSLYADVHLRGLTLVGVAPPLQDVVYPVTENEADDLLLESCRGSLVHVRNGSLVPSDATWYRVSG
jgi:threonine dehydrogenase-like Zn-dependent dehydrogenase